MLRHGLCVSLLHHVQTQVTNPLPTLLQHFASYPHPPFQLKSANPRVRAAVSQPIQPAHPSPAAFLSALCSLHAHTSLPALTKHVLPLAAR
ncbi:uncharacterized protein BKA78DRAFT_306534, partial [Phyllosticta capitalensis]